MQSISAGHDGKVWAICKDGGALLRHGITSQKPAGTKSYFYHAQNISYVNYLAGQFWLSVAPPSNGAESGLRAVSVGGATQVWAVDQAKRLYIRQEVTAAFPGKAEFYYRTRIDRVKNGC